MRTSAALAALAACVSLLAGCGAPAAPGVPTEPAPLGWDDLYRTSPDEYGVVCYALAGRGISCLRIKEPKQ